MIEINITSLDVRRWRRIALLSLALLLALWLAYLVREIWIPLLISFLIALVLDPLVDRMERRGWTRLKGVILIYTLFFILAGGTLALVMPAVVSQTITVTRAVGDYLPSGDNETQTKQSLRRILKKLHASPFVENVVMRASTQISQSFGRASSWVGQIAQSMATNVLWLIVIPIVSFYALKDFHLIYARLLLLVPREQRGLAQRLINEVTAIFVGYIRGTLIVCALNAVATCVVLALFHVPNGIALGAISGVLYVVPYLGPLLTYVMVGGACLTAGISLQTTLLVLVVLAVLHSGIFDQILTPRIVGKQVGLHPILAIVALLIGGSLLGIMGVLLAVPTAAIIQMVLMVLFPKLGQPIEVPAGEELHARVDEIQQSQRIEDEAQNTVDVHQTIMEAVDTAEETAHAEEQEREANAPIIIPASSTPPPSKPPARKPA